MWSEWLMGAGMAAAAAGGVALAQIRRRNMHLWLGSYLKDLARYRSPGAGEEVHLLLCIADHYEPKWQGASPSIARSRVDNWVQQYPRLFNNFRDSDGCPPRHTFFYPVDEYEAEYVDQLAGLCSRGFAEVEVHLHHDHDTEANLRKTLTEHARVLFERHGLLSSRKGSAQPAYGFIHGNWALDNSRPDGRWCGVNNELDILRDTGCYADFTLPSAPSNTQTRKINSIYYACDDPQRPKSHDDGDDVGTISIPPRKALMIIQGPLLPSWRRTRGIVPALKIENGCIQASQPPTAARLDLWLKARVGVPLRPDWYFVKLHTHGATEANQNILLGEPMVKLHEELARRAEKDKRFHFYYVTAREMYNLAKAAEAGWKGSVASARDWELAPPRAMRAQSAAA